jgi:PAS domain-containing protein
LLKITFLEYLFMTVRFTDILSSGNDTPNVNNRQDFVVRTRRPLWQTLFMMFASVLPISVILSIFVKDTIVFAEVLLIILVSLGTYVVLVVQRCRDLVLATEFQNALFSSALGHSNKFCLIIKDDNTVSYIDHSLQEMFPNFYKEPRRAIDVLLEQGQVSKEDRKMVFSAIERRVRGKVIFDIIDSKKKSHRIMMSIEPITRPRGFMLLRGREFVEKRVLGPQIAENHKLPIFNETNISMFSYIMDSMDIGAYMIDLFGKITYANLTLEQWLDFDEEELITNGLSLKDIISQTSLETYVEDLKNYEGEVLLQRKIGGYIKASINQKAMYDEQGTIIGYSTLVRQLKDTTPNGNITKNKNNAW